MKIVLLIDHLSGFGGAQRVITNIANRMTEKGNEVEFILTGNKISGALIVVSLPILPCTKG